MSEPEYLRQINEPSIAVKKVFEEGTVVDRSPYVYKIIDQSLRDLTNRINLNAFELNPDFKFYCIKLFSTSNWKITEGVIKLQDLYLSLTGYKVNGDTAIVLLKAEGKAEADMPGNTDFKKDFEDFKKESREGFEKMSGKIYALETFIVRQEAINEDVKNLKNFLDGHILLRATRNVSLKTIIGFIVLLLAFSDISSSFLTDFLYRVDILNKNQIEKLR